MARFWKEMYWQTKTKEKSEFQIISRGPDGGTQVSVLPPSDKLRVWCLAVRDDGAVVNVSRFSSHDHVPGEDDIATAKKSIEAHLEAILFLGDVSERDLKSCYAPFSGKWYSPQFPKFSFDFGGTVVYGQ